MPNYEYRCTQCQHVFECHQAVGEAAPDCPECGSASRKVFASVGLIFKGSGFHTTDYRKKSWGNGDKPAPSSETGTPTTSSETGTPTTSSETGTPATATSGPSKS
jgi:putative FmdB family regulatory protein